MPSGHQLAERPLDQLMECFADPAKARSVSISERAFWLEEVAACIAQTGEGGVSFLLWYMPRANSSRLRAILVALALVGRDLSPRRREEICDRVGRFLLDPRPLIAAEAIDMLGILGYASATNRVFRLRGHPSPYVAGAVLRFLSRNDRKRALPLLQAALEADDSIVRQNAIDELDELQHVRALPRIRKLLNDPDKDVRQAAETAVRNMEALSKGR